MFVRSESVGECFVAVGCCVAFVGSAVGKLFGADGVAAVVVEPGMRGFCGGQCSFRDVAFGSSDDVVGEFFG